MFVKKADTTIVRSTEDGAYLTNVATGENCFINETGLVFMKNIDGFVQDISLIAERLAPLYEDITKEELADDLTSFYQTMSESNYVVLAKERDEIEDYPLNSLHLEITNACNERCIHCFIPNILKKNAHKISYEHFRKIVDEFRNLGGQVITLSGGEPLLHESFLDMVNYCADKYLRVNLFSNLTLLNEKHIDTFSNIQFGLVQASVYSLDSKVHDYITMCSGSLEKTLASIRALISAGIDVQLAVPIMYQNKDSIADILDFVERNSVTVRFTTEIIPQLDGNDSFMKNYAINKQQKRHLVCDIIKKVNNRRVLNSLFEISENSNDLFSNPKSYLKSSFCPAGINSCSISADGNIYPCPSWHKYCLGNCLKDSMVNVWKKSSTLSWIRAVNRHETFKQCLECNLLDYCNRCLALNERINNGEILKVNQNNCEDAVFLKNQLDII